MSTFPEYHFQWGMLDTLRTLGPRLQKMVSYDGIPYQVKQRTGDRGITAENVEVTAYRFQRRYD